MSMCRCVTDARILSEARAYNLSPFPAGILTNAFSESKENDYCDFHAASSCSADGLRTEFGGETHPLLCLEWKVC